MRKIDEIIAVKVFNAARCTNASEANAIPKDTPFVTAWWVDSKGEEKAFWWRHSNVHNGAILQPFKPSESIEAAWEVVGWLQKKFPYGDIEISAFNQKYDKTVPQFLCKVISDMEEQEQEACEYGDTAPMAICKAALKALGVPESEITAAMEAK